MLANSASCSISSSSGLQWLDHEANAALLLPVTATVLLLPRAAEPADMDPLAAGMATTLEIELLLAVTATVLLLLGAVRPADMVPEVAGMATTALGLKLLLAANATDLLLLRAEEPADMDSVAAGMATTALELELTPWQLTAGRDSACASPAATELEAISRSATATEAVAAIAAEAVAAIAAEEAETTAAEAAAAAQLPICTPFHYIK